MDPAVGKNDISCRAILRFMHNFVLSFSGESDTPTVEVIVEGATSVKDCDYVAEVKVYEDADPRQDTYKPTEQEIVAFDKETENRVMAHLICPLCCDVFDRPVRTGCGHVFW